MVSYNSRSSERGVVAILDLGDWGIWVVQHIMGEQKKLWLWFLSFLWTVN